MGMMHLDLEDTFLEASSRLTLHIKGKVLGSSTNCTPHRRRTGCTSRPFAEAHTVFYLCGSTISIGSFFSEPRRQPHFSMWQLMTMPIGLRREGHGQALRRPRWLRTRRDTNREQRDQP